MDGRGSQGKPVQASIKIAIFKPVIRTTPQSLYKTNTATLADRGFAEQFTNMEFVYALSGLSHSLRQLSTVCWLPFFLNILTTHAV